MENKLEEKGLIEESIYKYDEADHEKMLKEKPWLKEDSYFKKVMLSTLATMKVVDHAIKGGNKEICGYLVGFAKENVFYVLDAVEIPIIGTDSRVEIAGQMGDKAHEYTMKFMDILEKVGREQKYVGWYHSHPGFGCWLSGIDCNTQKMMQMINKTFFALVVDPYRTLSNRKAEIGCFMCYQEGVVNKSSIIESIPHNRSEDFGIHASKYYKLEHAYFQSAFDNQIIKLMYKNYWLDTLSSNMIISNEEYFASQLEDMSFKIQSLNNCNDKNIVNKQIDDIIKINNQNNLNVQNELIKGIVFNNK